MAKSKVDPKRKKKKQTFKQKAKKMSEQAQTPKTHVIPDLQWDATDMLKIRGDLLNALNEQLTQANNHFMAISQNFQVVSQAMQQVFGLNIKENLIKLNYRWNNGVPLTEAEVKEYEEKVAEYRKAQKAEYDKAQKAIEEEKKLENAAKTGLVAPDGSPIGTTQDLNEDDDRGDVEPEPESSSESKDTEQSALAD